ncbi:MAG: class I tRNA ligase family protein, partial [Bacillota bacterium]|nr:class I tRNA ligase family protein [Bacillota bacterium]
AVDTPTTCTKCGSSELTQETDVLDTWFSSALWPFETLGWPDNTSDIKRFFPTSVLVTAYEIIYFWVARMVFMSLELTGKPPFSQVLIHGLVRDGQGRKMSKSLGNGIDPLEVVKQYGADTLRFTLLSGNTPGNDMRFYAERLEPIRNFCNKIWNASRFVLMNMEGVEIQAGSLPSAEELTLADKYILSRLSDTVLQVTKFAERFEFGEATRLLYDFIWSEFCDWYIEMTKAELWAGGERKLSTLKVLCYTLSRTLELLHPFMPFITEEIWQALPHEGESITITAWPTDMPFTDEKAAKSMGLVMDAIRSIRNIRAEMGVIPSKRTDVVIVPADSEYEAVYAAGAHYVKLLASGKEVSIAAQSPFAKGEAVVIVATGAEVYLPLSELVDVAAEISRLEKDHATLVAEVGRASQKLQNEGFLAKAKPVLIEQEKAKLAEYEAKLSQVERRLLELK